MKEINYNNFDIIGAIIYAFLSVFAFILLIGGNIEAEAMRNMYDLNGNIKWYKWSKWSKLFNLLGMYMILVGILGIIANLFYCYYLFKIHSTIYIYMLSMCIFISLIYFVINAFLIYYGHELYKNHLHNNDKKYNDEKYKKISKIIHILSTINIIFVFTIVLFTYYNFSFFIKKIPDIKIIQDKVKKNNIVQSIQGQTIPNESNEITYSKVPLVQGKKNFEETVNNNTNNNGVSFDSPSSTSNAIFSHRPNALQLLKGVK